MKKILVGLVLITAILSGAQPAYSMSTVKGWINKIRPGTFEMVDEMKDSAEQKARTFTESEMKVLTALSKREAELKKKRRFTNNGLPN